MVTFSEAQQRAMPTLIRYLQTQFELDLIIDGRSKPPFIPCPNTLGNDPCDDQDPDMDEDY